jgi:hypothetical protein
MFFKKCGSMNKVSCHTNSEGQFSNFHHCETSNLMPV